MDKASDYESGDSRLESWQFSSQLLLIVIIYQSNLKTFRYIHVRQSFTLKKVLQNVDNFLYVNIFYYFSVSLIKYQVSIFIFQIPIHTRKQIRQNQQ